TFGVTANSVTVLRNFPAKFIEIVLTQGDTVDRFGDNRSAAKCEATGRRPYTGRDPASQLAAGTDASAGERHPSAQQGASSGGSATQNVTRTDGSRPELLLSVPGRLIGGGPDLGNDPAGCLNGGTHAFRNHGLVLADVPRCPVRRISQALDGSLASFDPAHRVPLNRNEAILLGESSEVNAAHHQPIRRWLRFALLPHVLGFGPRGPSIPGASRSPATPLVPCSMCCLVEMADHP